MSFDKEKYSTKHIICPYCLHEREPDYERGDYDENDLIENECDNCEKKFFINASSSWSWKTSQDCELNNEAHDWRKEWADNKHIGSISNDGKSTYCICSKCEETQYLEESEIASAVKP